MQQTIKQKKEIKLWKNKKAILWDFTNQQDNKGYISNTSGVR